MTELYATDFYEILSTLKQNDTLRDKVLDVIRHCAMPGKVLEGDTRTEDFRRVLLDLIENDQTLEYAYQAAAQAIPERSSVHSGNRRVFPQGWAERITRTQLSVAYNEAVLRRVLGNGGTHVIVPHSSHEEDSTQCTRRMAGSQHPADELLDLLTSAYRDGVFSRVPKIPDHPHCTHVVKPIYAP